MSFFTCTYKKEMDLAKFDIITVDIQGFKQKSKCHENIQMFFNTIGSYYFVTRPFKNKTHKLA